MNFEIGQAAKAAALRTVSVAQDQHNNNDDGNDNDYDAESFADSQFVRRAANDQRGGDRWKSRGADGIWHRWHTSPRISLFTPCEVSKGTASGIGLRQHRTCGARHGLAHPAKSAGHAAERSADEAADRGGEEIKHEERGDGPSSQSVQRACRRV